MNTTINLERWLWVGCIGGIVGVFLAKTSPALYTAAAICAASMISMRILAVKEEIMGMSPKERHQWFVIRYLAILTIGGGFVAANALLDMPFLSLILPVGAAICLSVWLVVKLWNVRLEKRKENK